MRISDWSSDVCSSDLYLVDIVNIANADGRHCAVARADPADVAGINSRAELAAAEAQWQRFKREEAMAEGASLRAPETVWFSWDTELGRDVTIEPNVVFGPAVPIAANVIVTAYSHITGAQIAAGCEFGPIA